MGYFFVVVLIGLIPASIAKSKGKSFILWWIYGSLLFIIALPHSLIMKTDQESIENHKISNEGMKKCPFCGEVIKQEAIVCRYCGRDLPVSNNYIVCKNCNRKIKVTERNCPYCNTPNDKYGIVV